MAEWLSFGLVPFFSGGVKLTQARTPLPFAIAITIALILQRKCCRLPYRNAAGRTAYPEPELVLYPPKSPFSSFSLCFCANYLAPPPDTNDAVDDLLLFWIHSDTLLSRCSLLQFCSTYQHLISHKSTASDNHVSHRLSW